MRDPISCEAPQITDPDLQKLMDMLNEAMTFANEKRIPTGYFVATMEDCTRKPTLDEAFSSSEVEFLTGEVGPSNLCATGFTTAMANCLDESNIYAGSIQTRDEL